MGIIHLMNMRDTLHRASPSAASEIEAEIGRQQVHLLYRNAPLPIVANAINASLLATQASVGAGWGQINGQVVVKDWNSHVQVNDAPLPPGRPQTPGGTQRLPEPSAISLVALALLAARLSARRRA